MLAVNAMLAKKKKRLLALTYSSESVRVTSNRLNSFQYNFAKKSPATRLDIQLLPDIDEACAIVKNASKKQAPEGIFCMGITP